jgi:zinc protease
MRNAFIREDDRRPEMTVVRNEYERGENEVTRYHKINSYFKPQHALDKHIWSTAYFAHPYHHSTIGWRSDIENVPIGSEILRS